MQFIADLHIHSNFSMATARNLDLENVYISAQLKGITVVATGDFTHPGWFAELTSKLVPAEPGLFRLQPAIEKKCDQEIPPLCRGPVRFMLVTEISNIYKKNDRTRKNHNLVMMPNLAAARRMNHTLDNLGNIRSDGRPILGLDARNLLEIVLETDPDGFLIPAHIWTPWFSVLGSKSGFDSVAECFEDLSTHIFAVETGLSSDPPMNWRVSSLDRFTLVSNSDAHSPAKLGREANLFDTELSYIAIRRALESPGGNEFLGTLEFFPEEGKYHFDGHKKCGLRMSPSETIAHKETCPSCKKPLTLGVLTRVEQLADRAPGARPKYYKPFENLIPLTDALAQIYGCGVNTKTVGRAYRQALQNLGSELTILRSLPLGDIGRCGIPMLDEAIDRMRSNRIQIRPGYDGEYGEVLIFEPGERPLLKRQRTLFTFSASEKDITSERRQQTSLFISSAQTNPASKKLSQSNRPNAKQATAKQTGLRAELTSQKPSLNAHQQAAVNHDQRPLIIVAGPGTGKTLTITHRIAALITSHHLSPERILAVTFTKKAAEEMRGRLMRILNRAEDTMPPMGTFHAICLSLLKEFSTDQMPAVIDEETRRVLIADAIAMVKHAGIRVAGRLADIDRQIMFCKQQLLRPDNIDRLDPNEYRAGFLSVYRAYQTILTEQDLYDYDDLILETVWQLEASQKLRETFRKRYKALFVDEYQDVNHAQYRLMRALAAKDGRGLCVIGDPSQSIYGFRGSDKRYFNQFEKDYPQAVRLALTRNYRSTRTIVSAAGQIIDNDSDVVSFLDGMPTIRVVTCTTAKSEAVAIGRTIEQKVGGSGFHDIDTAWVAQRYGSRYRSFGDFAVLYRTGRQGRLLAEVFEAAGIPYQMPSRSNRLQRPGIKQLASLLRLTDNRGLYRDLDDLVLVLPVKISGETLQRFKTWGYSKHYGVQAALRHIERLPVKQIGIQRQRRLAELARSVNRLQEMTAGLPLTAKIKRLLVKTDLVSIFRKQPDLDQDIESVSEMSKSFGHDTAGLISALALESETDRYDFDVENVALMTMHAAKGLEFAVVFVAGCEDGLIPYYRSDDENPDLAEEKRLFYVAMTRAKEELHLYAAKRRALRGKIKDSALSPFVNQISKSLLDWRDKVLKKKSPTQQQLDLF